MLKLFKYLKKIYWIDLPLSDKEILLFFSIFFLGILLRLGLLFRPEQLWFDEILSLYISRYNDSIKNLISFIQSGEYHPPLYYILMFYWSRVFGVGEIAIRTPSVVFGVLSLFLIYIFSRKLFSRKVSLLALFLLAINPLHIEYSIEARPYAMFAFLGLLASYFLLLLKEKRKWYLWAIFVSVNLLGIYTHYSYLFILSAFALFMGFTGLNSIFNDKTGFSFKEIALFISAIFIGFLPWLPTFISRLMWSNSGLEFNTQKINDIDLMRFQQSYVEYIVSSLFWLVKFPIDKVELIMIAIGKTSFVSILLHFFIKNRKQFSWRYIYLVFLIIAPILSFLFSKYFSPYSVISSRHILFVVFPLCVLLSSGFFGLKVTRIKVALLTAVIVNLIPSLIQVSISDSLYDKDHRIKNIAKYIENNESPSDLILLDQHLFTVNFDYYFKGRSKIEVYFPVKDRTNRIFLSRGNLDNLKTKYMIHTAFLSQYNYQELSSVVENHKRVWLVQISGNYYFPKYFIENNWTLKDISDTPNTFSLLLFEKNEKQSS